MTILITLILIVFSSYLVLEVSALIRNLVSSTWPHSPGKLKNWNFNTTQDSENTTLHVKQFIYEYEVNERTYEGERLAFGFPKSMDAYGEGKIVEKIMKNTPSVTVYYSPKNHANSVLIVGLQYSQVIRIIVVLGIAIFIGSELYAS